MAPTRGPPGGRIALLGSPRGLTNGGERPALRRAGEVRAPRAELDLTLIGPVVAGLALGGALFLVAGPPTQGWLGDTAKVALAAASVAVAAVAVFVAKR